MSDAKDIALKITMAIAALAIVMFAISAYDVYKANKLAQTEAEIQTAKQNVTTAQAQTNSSIQNYTSLKSKNIAKETEVTQNAYNKACDDCSNDADTLIAWNKLVTRACERNRQWSAGKH